MVAKVATRNRDQVARARSAKKTAGRNVVARQLAPLSAVGAASHFCFAFPAHTSIITLSGMGRQPGENHSLRSASSKVLGKSTTLRASNESAKTAQTADNQNKNQSHQRSALALRTPSDSGNNPIHVVLAVRIEKMKRPSE